MKLTDDILKKLVIQTLNEAKKSEKGKGALVSVKAAHKPTKEQVKPTFKKKTTAPKNSTSDPFIEKAKEDALDKFDKAPKTAAKVEKIATKGKSVDSKTGAQKGSFKAKATKPEEPKRIAKPAFVVKESYSKSDLAKFIYEQAKKSLK